MAIVAGGAFDVNQLVVGVQGDCDDTAWARPVERRDRRLLYGSLGGGEEHKGLLELLDGEHRPMTFAGLHLQ